MPSFLDTCTEHLTKKYASELNQGAIVLPTRRSAWELEDKLKDIAGTELPKIQAIEDFVQDVVGYRKINPVVLLLEVYEIFRKIDDKIKLEKFTGWGAILLRDFDLIDRNLISPEQLFKNLSDIKNIERWEIDEKQISAHMQDYFQLWENLQEVYSQLKARLLDLGTLYSGLMYRQLAEQVDTLLLNHPHYQYFVFIGFNALSKSEEKIFSTLLKHQKAEVIWDCDDYYMQENPDNKAGYFLQKYKKDWARATWDFQSRELLDSPKNIQVFKVINASMQAKVANQILLNLKKSPPSSASRALKTALVLGDEHLLSSVIQSLDPAFAGMNISLGLSLKDSALFNLIDALFEQAQMSIRDKESRESMFSFRSISKLFNHPLVKQFESRKARALFSEATYDFKSILNLIIQQINRENRIFIKVTDLESICQSILEEELQYLDAGHRQCYQDLLEPLASLFKFLFHPLAKTMEIIESFEGLAQLLLVEEKPLEAAYFKEFLQVLGQMKTLSQQRPGMINPRTFKTFLYQAFWEIKFDYDAHQDSDYQLLGVAETRNLDFDTVIIFSLNESILPRSKKVNSFIPHDIARKYGLPTYDEQDAVVSYHFYRLLQRASQVYLLYVNPSDTYGAKEKSRFIHQLENDLAKHNPKINIEEVEVQFRTPEANKEEDLKIRKDEQIIRKIKESLAQGFSASHLNDYISCSLRYYFQYVASISQRRVLEEHLDERTLGNLIHELLEEMFQDLSSKFGKIGFGEIETLLPDIPVRIDAKLQQEHFSHYLKTGKSLMVLEAAEKMLFSFLKSQIDELKGSRSQFEIISLENLIPGEASSEKNYRPQFVYRHQLDLGDDQVLVKLKGIIDRIDQFEGEIRLIDYKTRRVVANDLRYSQEELKSKSPANMIRQLWFYKFMLSLLLNKKGSLQIGDFSLHPESKIKSGIYSLNNPQDFLILPRGKEKDFQWEKMSFRDFIIESNSFFTEIIAEILDPEHPFEKTQDKDDCKYCNFKEICGR